MVAWNIKEPALHEYTPYTTTLLAGTRDDRLREHTPADLATVDTCGMCERSGVAWSDHLDVCEECAATIDGMIEQEMSDTLDTQDDTEERNDWSERLQDPTSEPW